MKIPGCLRNACLSVAEAVEYAMVSQISVLGCSDYDGTSCITAAAHAKWPAHAASLRPQARHTWICPLKVVSKIATSI